MSMKPLRILCIGVVASGVMLGVAGCVTVKPDERFPDVQRQIDDRLGPAMTRVHWRLGTPEDGQADALVNDLLTRPLTPEGAVQVALLRSRDLQAVYEDLGVAQADLVHAGLLKNPDLAGFVRFPDSGPSGVNWNVGLDFWLDIFLVPLRKRIAGAELEASLLRVTDAVLDKATLVRRAYFQYLADTRVLTYQRALVEFTEIGAELAKRQQAQGHIADLDSANQQAAAEEAGLALDQAEVAARISRETLRRLLDLTDSDIPWTIDESLAATPLPAAEPDAETLVATALDKRVDLALLGREIELQRMGLEMDKNWLLTNGAVGVETERSSDGVQSTGPHISLELPIFHQHQAVYARREAQIRQAEDRLASRRGAARAEVRIAAERMALARRAAERYERSIVPLRQKIVGLTQAEYNAMIVGVPDLLAAKSAEIRVGSEQARAVQDYWTARAELERVIGVKLPDLPVAAPIPSPMPALKNATPTAMPDMPGMSTPAPDPKSPPPTAPVPTMPDMPGMNPK
ncbi:MAG: TolC family protein [Phycisphaeraceae bacterium]|nr:TolC family protein [Phycisphaeraceae bacterium]MCW5767064.1 TolC family protein [Phycisphaeraceae bacterium]